jgi:hypothetical protein
VPPQTTTTTIPSGGHRTPPTTQPGSQNRGGPPPDSGQTRCANQPSPHQNNVAALITTGNGQPAVDIVDSDGTQQFHLVSLGIFDDANGLVQIYGSGLGAGQHVAVPGHGKTS